MPNCIGRYDLKLADVYRYTCAEVALTTAPHRDYNTLIQGVTSRVQWYPDNGVNWYNFY